MTWQDILNALGADRYQQHALCLTGDPVILTLYVASDLTTWLAYFAIGLTLLFRTVNFIDLGSSALIRLFGAFIFLCGLSHLTMVLTLFWGIYWLDVAVRAAMASVSAVTAVYTFQALLPERST
ncbi:hypothetical protein [Chelatococcus reniformis]|uniref:Ethylene receptor 1-like N-terminal domain-containing protein n=1 Tax=Chelatococcus reniformis TaxID=1494448 RepID=A0A916UG31_9HYPH|nr:hypothetical protein [Chelatococcus reniformis]GGC71026.1 hypothetical protein GCM10010994_31940 [Chelatococcus reniformis]